ncbi:class I SAM-dependent methyltransferase [Spirosoma sp. SC4-14]|uniref:class I SAM-dependent methyltransferase n=1 Tax=Spirosoma sp. SC4-14 TaxID=3128900 RepID=UPI0030D2530E
MNKATTNAIDFHTEIATEFDQRYAVSKAFSERFAVWTRLFERYISPTDNVLDIGCGSGIFSHYLARKGCSVTGIDGSPEMIRLATQKQPLTTARFEVQALPLTNTTGYAGQDVVIASSLFEYIANMPALLQQVRLVLKTNGLFIVSMPNQTSFYRHLERFMFRLTGFPRYFSYIHNVSTVTNFNQQLGALGFDLVETEYFAGHDPVSRVLKFALPKKYVNNLFVGVYRKR